jgi:hypothetical protein
VRTDLEDCVASIRARRVYGIFRTGVPEAVAHALTGLRTNALPAVERDVLIRHLAYSNEASICAALAPLEQALEHDPRLRQRPAEGPFSR